LIQLGDRLEIKNKQELKNKVLRLLSVDARISMQDLANQLGTTKANAYSIFNEVISEYGISFVPEISIDKLWKWEFIKKARLRTKRGIIADAVEELPLTGFGEYMTLIKFSGKKPSEEEIRKAVGDSYVPQFAAITKGDYDLMIYIIARSYEDAIQFTDTVNKSLGKYEMLAYTDRVWRCFGFFPLNNKLIEQFDIFDTYKNLLFGLNGSGRNTFTDIGKKFNQGPAQMLYAYDRLAKTEILKRVTYFESKPKTQFNTVAMIRIKNGKNFEMGLCNWTLKLLKEYVDKENECAFMCNVANPKGMMIISSFQTKTKAEKFFSGMRASIKGVDISMMQISNTLLGSLGLRDFDMRYTAQYKDLERKKLVPPVKEKVIDVPVENPDIL
jgi:DNA-binding Lrp family transcriptional regulator